jgi:hypothetical protein
MLPIYVAQIRIINNIDLPLPIPSGELGEWIMSDDFKQKVKSFARPKINFYQPEKLAQIREKELALKKELFVKFGTRDFVRSFEINN